jgi:hypothetical protein
VVPAKPGASYSENNMSENIEGKVVVITGASSGLGEATAWLLSAQGAAVVLESRRVERLRSLAGELTGRGAKALAVSTDITDRDHVKGLVDAAVNSYGRIDVMLVPGRGADHCCRHDKGSHLRAGRLPDQQTRRRCIPGEVPCQPLSQPDDRRACPLGDGQGHAAAN